MDPPKPYQPAMVLSRPLQLLHSSVISLCLPLENFLTLLQSGLRSQEVEDVAMVSSAVWALLNGCHKVSITMETLRVTSNLLLQVKASLKKSPLPELLRHSHTALQDSGSLKTVVAFYYSTFCLQVQMIKRNVYTMCHKQ